MPMIVNIPDINGWDDSKEEFINLKGASFTIEHSLISLQKWESRWHKSYIHTEQKTPEEIIDYIRCMTITPGINPEIYKYIPTDVMKQIVDYISDPMTATTINEKKLEGASPNARRREIITAEIIYYMMIEYDIPVEYRKWHLNQLMTLIRVCQIKSDGGGKKMSRAEVLAQNKALNAKRRAKRR